MSLFDSLLQKSPLSFDRYMDLALYHPQFGYYASKVNFGAAGDFVTAPTLTPEFSQALGKFLLRAPEFITQNLIELGPGNGQLAYDLLLFLAAHQALPERYYLVETSAHLKKMQQALLARLPSHLFALVEWVSLDELQDLKAVVIANEFFDALPVVRFTITAEGIKELYVQVKDHQLTEIITDARPEVTQLISPLALPVGYTSEVCLAYRAWANILAKVLTQGEVLIIDYGYDQQEYYQPERRHGTLQGYYQHQAVSDYLAHPGAMDLTAHVNFSHLSQTLLNAGFQFDFFTYQNVFLLDHGLNQNLEIKPIDTQQKIRRLLDPRLMGEHFKVLAFSKQADVDYAPRYELSKFL